MSNNAKGISSEQAQKLLDSVAFQDTVDKIRHIQVGIFLKPTSKVEEREEAHQITKALGKIESLLRVSAAESERKRK